MQPASVMEPIAAIMRAWVGGWTRSRGTAPAESTDFGLRIQVDDGSESVRRVLLDPTPYRLAAVIAQATEPKACVKFPGDPAQWLPHFPPDWQPQDEQWLMTVPLLNPVSEVFPPVGYTVDTTVQPGVVTVSVLDDTGAPAASGRAGPVAESGVSPLTRDSATTGRATRAAEARVSPVTRDSAVVSGGGGQHDVAVG